VAEENNKFEWNVYKTDEHRIRGSLTYGVFHVPMKDNPSVKNGNVVLCFNGCEVDLHSLAPGGILTGG